MSTRVVDNKSVSPMQRHSLGDVGAVYLFSALGLALTSGVAMLIGLDKLAPTLVSMTG